MNLETQAVSLFGSPLGELRETGGGPAGTALSSAPAAAAPPAPFADLLVSAVGEVDKMENDARTAVEGLMTGQGVDVHQAMIAATKADTGFELVLAVRNKALAAYQQVMGMQF